MLADHAGRDPADVEAQGEGEVAAFLRRSCHPLGVQVVVEADPAVGLQLGQVVDVENGALFQEIRDAGPEISGHGIDDGKAGEAAGGVEKAHARCSLEGVR